ncbi:MAG: RluA family pseudouridine synthase [Planctomycetes bacterium]|nr:RluA family pseudouridine synthase [Planctomycetota bacterium]MCC7397224.1 RluA family pseudouridine synthase [Planctomycetota bacterium]
MRKDRVFVVERGLAHARLEDFLCGQLQGVRRLAVRQAIQAGQVRVNGESCVANRSLRVNDVVQLAVAPEPALAEPTADPTAWSVRFESASALVIDKPAGLTTVPDRSGVQRGLYGGLEALRPGADLRIVHRLDRDTSGCLLLAKGIDAARHFDAEFRAGRVRKVYVALVQGVPAASQFAIDAWLGPDRSRGGKVVASDGERKGYRPAHTDVSLRQAFAQHALLELRPTTGRSHQLRVHLQSVGLPIAGDRDYGGEPLLLSRLKPGYKLRPGVVERPLAQRMFLHAERLTFHDVDGREVVVEAPLPEDLAVALRQVQNFADRRR